MKKRLLSSLLTLCMLLSLLPTAALAVGGAGEPVMTVTINGSATNYTDPVAGWNAAVGDTNKTGATVQLLDNWTATATSGADAALVTSFGTGAGFGNGKGGGAGYILVPSGKTITLDLNDYTIDRGLQETAVSEGEVIAVKGNLTLKDSGTAPAKQGTITGANISDGYGAVYVEGGSFTMEGGSITDNKAYNTGSDRNAAAGGVYTSGVFTMTGGSITGNTGSGVKSVGGVYVADSNGSTFTMTGGSITGNKSDSGAGGVFLETVQNGSNNSLTVGGTAKIMGNLKGGTASNVLLQKCDSGSRTITCFDTTPLAPGATIGVTTEAVPVAGTPVTITGNNSQNYSSFFFSDSASYETRNSGDNGTQVVQMLLNSDDDFADGDGSASAPYQIANAEQLSRLTAKVNNKEASYVKAHYQLTNNITLKSGENWIPIGTATNAFKGNFDGNGKTITGLTVTGGEYSGLFGWIQDATVKNLTVSTGTVSGSSSTGAIVGYATSSTIENCRNESVTVAGTSSSIGGIAGYLNSSTLLGSTNSAAVSSTAKSVIHDVGGVAGMNSNGSTVVNCVNYGAVSITGINYYSDGVGGVVGRNNSATITNCANYGAVTNSNVAQGTNSDAKKATGGVVGLNEDTVTNCVNSGTVADGTTSDKTQGFVGGVVGYNKTGTSTPAVVQFSYTTTEPVVSAVAGANTGTITGCGTYDSGKITLINDFVAGKDQNTQTTTYVPDGNTAPMTALNSWVESADGTLNVNFWGIDGGNLIPTVLAVTFDPNGGSVTPIRATTAEDKLSSLPTPTRDGHTFDGWFTEKSGGTAVTKETKFTTSTTIYAHWTASSGGGGYIPPVQTTVDSGKEVSASSLDSLASENKTLTINGKNGEKLVLDAETVKALAKEDGNLVVTVGDAKGKLTPEQAAQAGDRPVYDLTAILNGKIVTNFGGKITVSLPYLLKDGQNPEDVTVWYLASDGSMTEIPATYDPKTGLATFTVTHFSEYVVGVASWVNPFTDVKAGDWYYDAVKYVHKNGMFSGTSATTFAPDAATTRAMLWAVLARQAGQDTAGGVNWYEKAQAWAVAKGVSDGTNPTGEITREQLVAMLWRYSGSPTAKGDLSKFTDADSVSAYAKQAMAWAVEKGLVQGANGALMPKQNATRAQVAAIMMRYCENAVAVK